MQARNILLLIHVTVCILENANFSGKYNILPFKKCAEHQKLVHEIR